MWGHSSHLWRTGRESEGSQGSARTAGKRHRTGESCCVSRVGGCTHHARRPLLRLTLPAEPWTRGHLDDAVACWDTNTRHTLQLLFPFPNCHRGESKATFPEWEHCVSVTFPHGCEHSMNCDVTWVRTGFAKMFCITLHFSPRNRRSD